MSNSKHLERRHQQMREFKARAHAQLAGGATVHELAGATYYELEPPTPAAVEERAHQFTLPGVVL